MQFHERWISSSVRRSCTFSATPDALAVVAREIADALAHGGRLLTAHAFLLADNPSRTGFDWEQPFGASTIADAFLAAGLTLEQSIRTDLYRVDLFRRGALHESFTPSIRHEPFGSPLPHEVERGVVWGGAVVRRSDVASTDTNHVPVLLYHRVAADGPRSLADYCIAPSLFEEQMRFLRRHGFHTVTSADVEQYRRERRPMRGRPVLITFDDGYRDFYEVAWPILRRFGFTAEVFLPTDLVGGTAGWDSAHGAPADLMNWEEIRRAHAEGVHFGSHLASHALATGMDSETLLLEGVRSRSILERRLGCEVRSVAPPYGACDERVVRVLQSCGFTQIFTTDHELATMDRWSATVPRIAISGQDIIETFAARLGAAAFDPGAADAPLVTAVVPACNAETTIDETLRSVRAQTYRNLEILVVDDGSTDGTAALVEAHASADPRVRLIRQSNAGVAAARNRGISESAADFVAPVDADDLWMPTKIEKQMAAMRSRGPRCGLVYTWQTTIDEHGRVMSPRRRWESDGYVLPQMLYGNLVGSGSPALMRKQAVIDAGGYDASLRERGAQGCEDFKLYLQISERYEFAVIKEHLTGYRELRDAMSMDFVQMVRSDELVGVYAERAHPRPRATHPRRTDLLSTDPDSQSVAAGARSHRGNPSSRASQEPSVARAQASCRDAAPGAPPHRAWPDRDDGRRGVRAPPPVPAAVRPVHPRIGGIRAVRAHATRKRTGRIQVMPRILQQVRIIAPFTKGYTWAAPVLAVLGLGASFAESAAISLVTLFLYTAIGPGVDAAESSGILQRVFAGARGITGDNPARLAAVIGLLVLLKAVLNVGYGLLSSMLKNVISERVRNAIYAQYLHVSYGYIQSRERGELVNVLATESWTVAEAFLQPHAHLSNVCSFAVFGAALVAISWPIAMAAAVTTAATFAALRALSRPARRPGSGGDRRKQGARGTDGQHAPGHAHDPRVRTGNAAGADVRQGVASGATNADQARSGLQRPHAGR